MNRVPIYGKLCNVQRELMDKSISSIELEDLLPLIFKVCLEENLMFYFNFIENACVLNLRDISSENLELNVRLYYSGDDDSVSCEKLKKQVLLNTFLLTKKGHQVASSAKKEKTGTHIISGDKPVPAHISKAIKKIQSKGIPVTREAIQHHLPLGEMSTSARMECNKYLSEMEDI